MSKAPGRIVAKPLALAAPYGRANNPYVNDETIYQQVLAAFRGTSEGVDLARQIAHCNWRDNWDYPHPAKADRT